MKVSVVRGKATSIKTDLLALGLSEDGKRLKDEAAELDKAMGGAISKVIATGTDFAGKLKDRITLIPTTGVGAKRLMLVGLGPARSIDAEVLRRMSAAAVREATKVKASSLALVVPQEARKKVNAQDLAQAMCEGVCLGAYLFEQYRSGERKEAPKSAELVTHDAGAVKAMKAGVEAGQIISEAVVVARDLANHPANVATPSMLAEEAQKLGRSYGLKVEVFGPKEIEKMNMGGMMAVSSGTSRPPRFIVIRHAAARGGNPVVLVGKGLTFDSGGLSIKPADNMDRMKGDMSGGAAVIAALTAVARLGLRTNVVGIVPAVENMPGCGAYHPGDVVKISDGKTIEIISTDAEGRLVLADAIVYARGMKPAAIIDVATLTGACMVALGSCASGLFGNDDALVGRIESAAASTHERVWRLPMWDDYFELIKGDIADMKNSGGRPAGAITAALLLAEFAKGIPWAHLDIAGTAYAEKDSEYVPKGGTGVCVRLLVELLREWPRRG